MLAKQYGFTDEELDFIIKNDIKYRIGWVVMNFIKIDRNDSNYPKALSQYLGEHTPKNIMAIGNLDILKNKILAIFSSIKCPGAIILKTYDLMKNLRESDITVISGFHSPMERECLNILLKGKQPIILCPARSMKGMRLQAEYKEPINEKRLLLISPFDEKENRISSERSLRRNYFVAALADAVFIPYAMPSSKTERFCKELLTWNKPMYTFHTESNANLVALGIKPITQEILVEL
jgi:predicted Rossmann fold nucleotide-binding protein DprA/Smf involved in DNA uptake